MLATHKRKVADPPVPLRQRSHLGVVAPTRSSPPWLMLLLALRKVSTPLVVLLTLSVLPLYGWTVHTQKDWGNTYAQLEQLKRNERNLLVQLEGRRYSINENAEKNPAGLTPKGPHNTLFVKPEPAKRPQPLADEPLSPLRMSPIGY